ncbi:glutamate transport system permease protein [Psychromicrobium silvestre]|uniref:Glutamate transport system permease protein n=1 Tax=Psychromicrobium silvestre TaxID=1645614 RepID=A0A7Y9S8F7_9MICC|nr:amino acid ABC transporter permease [Psychromicrobium silvestre]NYE96410.1 glutamate transport system permease protein [Psychromicrobium silvestre]
MSALFDAPGPRTKRRIRWLTVLSILVSIGLLALAYAQFYRSGQLAPSKWAEFRVSTSWLYLLGALGNTALAALGAAAIALPLGLFLALGRLSKLKLLRWPSTAVIEFLRSVPLLLIIYIFMSGLPNYGVNPDVFWKLVIPIGICSGATIAEVFRAGILALPQGQNEAAIALGLSKPQALRLVVLPQAVRIVLPALIAQVVILLKDTTLGYVVSYGELQQASSVLVASTGHLVQTYLIVTVIYIGLNVLISNAANAIDRRLARRRAGTGSAERGTMA